MHRIHTTIILLATILFATGCTSVAPQYSASLDNVQKLKDAGNFTAKIGEFSLAKDTDKINSLSIRANALVSPYQSSYANYLAEALKQELILSQKFNTNADIEVSGVLAKNAMDASGFTKGLGDISARFVVKKGVQIRYDQIKSAQHEWESSFAGAIAIPRAAQEYPNLVQKLLAVLYADPEFLKALK